MASSDSKVVLAVISSIIVAVVALLSVSTDIFPKWSAPLIIPAVAYMISVVISSIYQYSSCSSVNIQAIGLSNTFVLGTNLIASSILYMENIPFLKQFFGTYAPRNPYDGMPYEEGTAAWIAGMKNENHYKLQFLSSIVKAVIPMYFDENTKIGIVHFYWIFWATILPLFFLLSFQGLCTQ
jgi:hypothetical protein